MNGSENIQQSRSAANLSQARVNWLAWFALACTLAILAALVWRAGWLDSIVQLVARKVPNPYGWE